MQKVQLLSSPLTVSTFAWMACSMSGMEGRQSGQLSAASAWPKKRVPACAWHPSEHAYLFIPYTGPPSRGSHPWHSLGADRTGNGKGPGHNDTGGRMQLVLCWACKELTVGCVLGCSTCLVDHHGAQQETA